MFLSASELYRNLKRKHLDESPSLRSQPLLEQVRFRRPELPLPAMNHRVGGERIGVSAQDVIFNGLS